MKNVKISTSKKNPQTAAQLKSLILNKIFTFPLKPHSLQMFPDHNFILLKFVLNDGVFHQITIVKTQLQSGQRRGDHTHTQSMFEL